MKLLNLLFRKIFFKKKADDLNFLPIKGKASTMVRINDEKVMLCIANDKELSFLIYTTINLKAPPEIYTIPKHIQYDVDNITWLGNQQLLLTYRLFFNGLQSNTYFVDLKTKESKVLFYSEHLLFDKDTRQIYTIKDSTLNNTACIVSWDVENIKNPNQGNIIYRSKNLAAITSFHMINNKTIVLSQAEGRYSTIKTINFSDGENKILSVRQLEDYSFATHFIQYSPQKFIALVRDTLNKKYNLLLMTNQGEVTARIPVQDCHYPLFNRRIEKFLVMPGQKIILLAMEGGINVIDIKHKRRQFFDVQKSMWDCKSICSLAKNPLIAFRANKFLKIQPHKNNELSLDKVKLDLFGLKYNLKRLFFSDKTENGQVDSWPIKKDSHFTKKVIFKFGGTF